MFTAPKSGRIMITPHRKEPKARRAPRSSARSALQRRAVVLLVEDDADWRELLTEALETDGYEVVGVRDGVEALNYLNYSSTRPQEFEPPDIVVSDVRMPRVTGLDLLGYAKRRELPVILITGMADETIHARARELGVASTFTKPFDIDDLRRTIGVLVR
jgi:DNA-binding response OmpR family regulator